jgi:hypothetical protein
MGLILVGTQLQDSRRQWHQSSIIEEAPYYQTDKPLNMCFFIDMCGYEVGKENKCTEIKLDLVEAGCLSF